MKIKPIVIATGLVVPLSLFLFNNIDKEDSLAVENTNKHQDTHAVIIKDVATKEVNLQQKVAVPVHRSPNPEVDKLALYTDEKEKKWREPRHVEEVWVDINPSDTLDKIKPKSTAIEAIKAIEFSNVPEFKALNLGDKLTLNLPDDSNIDIEVESNEFQNEGIRTWSGNFTIDDQSYPVTFTFGSSSILGFIGHPSGSIKIEGRGRTAWIYEVPDSHGYDY
ncbi:hypothetical protein VINI7043_09574 [Vibrio nigripulchritudo ATCC 27043]|uniref:hypothetical protein n=1 Tax=Vibrio nigripulchritudo TaxID=28173 RepID=UPI00021C26B9|nr:hypothetical protein [Vibrio nigripulchritudo]EGU56249.1 hypothetical protein VINI7043_09574 [Vibrio nigripulchritudo ATCC 27043]